MTLKRIVLRVLFFRAPDDPGCWIAQSLEKDISASGRDVDQAKLAFERTVAGYLMQAQQYHREPLARLGEAPDVFWEMWDRLAEQVHPQAERFPSVPAYMLPVVSHDTLQAGHSIP